jgi:hypothetical protein
MRTSVSGFIAGCLAGGFLTVWSTGSNSSSDIGETAPHVVVCQPGDVWCQVLASATATRACRIMPGRQLAYGRPFTNGEIHADLVARGLLQMGQWLEGEDCEQ